MKPSAYLLLLVTLLGFSTSNLLAQNTNKFDRDTLIYIDKSYFDVLVDSSIHLLNTTQLDSITDAQHRKIMMCVNTISMAWDSTLQNRFVGGRYQTLEQALQQADYLRNIVLVYPEWVPNRGMGYYFPKIRMELYGTPSLYSWFQVRE